jgi:hypothetical protein
MTIRRPYLLLLLLLLGACGGASSATELDPDGPGGGRDTARVPLGELGAKSYFGFQGGLYPNASNEPPAAHAAAGLAAARQIQPLAPDGTPDPKGKYVLLSIGMSNTTQEFCSQGAAPPCDAWTFMGRAAADPAVNHTTLAIVNGAFGGRAAPSWRSPSSPEYDRIRDTRLQPAGLSEAQVQIVWLKVANSSPRVSLPSPQADAYVLEREMGEIVRALRTRYPNLRQLFLSSRIYAGYATTSLNPEPYAYESGFAVKWTIAAQIEQMRRGGSVADTLAGNLDYRTVAPWVAWGPYLWGAGKTPRADGLVWERSDFENDGTHPSQSGRAKVGALLLDFFKSAPSTRCWFLAGESCGG